MVLALGALALILYICTFVPNLTPEPEFRPDRHFSIACVYGAQIRSCDWGAVQDARYSEAMP